jgi:hypothetical protein
MALKKRLPDNIKKILREAEIEFANLESHERADIIDVTKNISTAINNIKVARSERDSMRLQSIEGYLVNAIRGLNKLAGEI